MAARRAHRHATQHAGRAHPARLEVIVAYPHVVVLADGLHPWRVLGRFLRRLIRRSTPPKSFS
jgi:hypothetical protein